MAGNTFQIEASTSGACWAELDDGRVTIHRTRTPDSDQSRAEDEVVLEWNVEILRNLLTWAAQEGTVTASFTGPMAGQIREGSKELGMTPEMFVWHAVKVFVEVGSST